MDCAVSYKMGTKSGNIGLQLTLFNINNHLFYWNIIALQRRVDFCCTAT